MSIKQYFESNRSLKELTTLGIGGPARYFIKVDDITILQATLKYCSEENYPFYVLGKGSNSLFDDRGYEGLVILNRIPFLNKLEDDLWHVGAGYSFSLLGSQTARQGLAGLEFASGIPGSVGGAVFMNAGANGRETFDSLISVDWMSKEGKMFTLPKAELEFGYRFSSFQQMEGAIAGATFKLEHSAEARHKQLEIIQYRKKTQPYDAQSAGCVFKNPSCGHAGALIEQSGLKGFTHGGAQVSTLHANFLINAGNATSAELLQLMQIVQNEVKNRQGIFLEAEVRYVPYTPLKLAAPYA